MPNNETLTFEPDVTPEVGAEQSPLHEIDQAFQQMEQSVLGYGDEEQNLALARALTECSYQLHSNTDGDLMYMDSDLSSPEDYRQLGRLLKSAVEYGYFANKIQKIIDGSNDQRVLEAFNSATPYEVNYFAIKAIATKWAPQTPGTEDYAKTFETSGQEHITTPAALLNPEDLKGRDAKESYKAVADAYFQQMAVTELEKTGNRLDALKENDLINANELQPECTVCVPVAAFGETEATIRQTLESISSQTISGQTEVVLYLNYKKGEDVTDEALEEKRNLMKRLQKDVQGTKPDAPRIRFVIEGYEPEELSISRIRKDYMDMMALDLHNRGAEYNHTVLWLDADTTKLSGNAVEKHVKSHQENPYELKLTSSSVRFTMTDMDSDSSDVSQAHKLAGYAELQRRRNIKDSRGDHYTEESGLSFSIGSYLLIGGVNAGDDLNEATWLDINAQTYSFASKRIFGDKASYSVSKLASARVYTSGRRQVENAEKHLEGGNLSLREFLYFTHDSDNFTGSDNAVRGGNTKQKGEYDDILVQDAVFKIDRFSAVADRTREESDLNLKRNERARRIIGV